MSAAPDSQSEPLFGVVVLNWNNADDTLVCLDSLWRASPRPACVVVVDNGSRDSSVAQIRQWVHLRFAGESEKKDCWLSVIEAGRNRGFAGGTNLGIKHLRDKTRITHILLINNDATVSPPFFSDIGDVIRDVPGAGLIGATIFESENGKRVWYAGGVEHPLRALYKHSYRVPESLDPVPTDFVTGCAMVISRPLLERIGPLAECYFPAYWEDGEYSFRARQAQFPVLYAPRAKVFHRVGGTVRGAGLDAVLASAKNRLRVFYVRRNYRGWTRVVALGYLAITKPGRAAIEAMQGRPRIGWEILKGTVSGFVSTAARD
ncbi:MAG: glycosyltransferase family 2 protein [Gemmatimonadales bacterium]